MTYRYLKTRQVNQTLWVEIHNPPVNFIITDMLAEMHHLIRKVSRDDSIRVFILTGGREDSYIMHFSIGELAALTSHLRRLMLHILVRYRLTSALLKYYMTFSNWLMDLFPWYETLMLWQARAIRGYSSGMLLWVQMTRTYFAIERMNKVTIAAINGSCNGGGTEMAACFDFRFMVGDQGFTMGQPEVLVNIVPGGGGTQRLPRLMGRARALELMLRGCQWTPQEARQAGLLTDIFDKAEFVQKVQSFADRMSKRPPVAIDAIKKSVVQGESTTLRHGLSIELEQSVRCFDTKDTEMALKNYLAYIEKNIMTLDHENATTKEIVDLLHKTLDVMENAKIFDRFEGK
ncbi:enoyl-CoA hydratase/isomerase family protein [Desulfosudis oleivorans]|uniref:Enoyl-CoA hydratase/isomerase n=1 Tax=Desulfosudis oleivorans (strain DSM 6200 / JCM 39069 / Hxd3) TaxID=96561 RepID=A9A0E6_DESOH|nr:enoyl-CoA hydratase/isomerase family protein [Desulfosudis oleivorans]ABW67446.1 Enoyl-CoA hydratase/isomerase [Desulfosudis oleivorans Hxd3]